jgi:hypothetical protein
MSLDFQQIRQQIIELGSKAPERQKEISKLRDTARKLLTQNSMNQDFLREKLSRVVNLNHNFRCAIPTEEAFSQVFQLPETPREMIVVGADGSQINPDAHLELDYCLVNVGAFIMKLEDKQAPQTFVQSELYYDDDLYTPSGVLTQGMIALMRDTREREFLAEIAENIGQKVITVADGPIELWGREELVSQHFERYLMSLSKLHKLGAITAGYVDRPRSDLVIRLLELSALDENKLGEAGKERFLLGVRDTDLWSPFLDPGARSAVFGIQSKTATQYDEELALHFFYLNASLKEGSPYLVRVEIPAWVAGDQQMLNVLHAVLVSQCQIIPGSKYPYALHRAHETAVVTYAERDQVTEMISNELIKNGVLPNSRSSKQIAKDF